ncbi:type II secretion system protein [Tautonia rosea]|uniref:type II secretion system protein n=1 Tax=Tautonia rosea TaxID=2728037 RepID=UPI0014765D18|nr:hypothetical protein [Tautonia rosea]
MRRSILDVWPPSTLRRGSTYLEVQVAFAVLGVALAGLAPIVASQTRLISQIEQMISTDAVNYLVPAQHLGASENLWVRKLGFDATLSVNPPATNLETPIDRANSISITSSNLSLIEQNAWVEVSVTPIDPEPEGTGPSGEDPPPDPEPSS